LYLSSAIVFQSAEVLSNALEDFRMNDLCRLVFDFMRNHCGVRDKISADIKDMDFEQIKKYFEKRRLETAK